jgi:hypothetical protein
MAEAFFHRKLEPSAALGPTETAAQGFYRALTTSKPAGDPC